MSCSSSSASDGQRLESVRARPELPEELKLIVAAGGDPERLAREGRGTAAEALKRLGFSNFAIRNKLLQALVAWTPPKATAVSPMGDQLTVMQLLQSDRLPGSGQVVDAK